MKNKNISKNFLKVSMATMVTIIFIMTSLSSVAHIETFDSYEGPQIRTVELNKQPPLQGRVTYPDDLSDPNNTADYLIITSDAFYYDAKLNRLTIIRNKPIVEITFPPAGMEYWGSVMVVQGTAVDPDNDRIESLRIWESLHEVFNDTIVFDDNHGNVSWHCKIEFPYDNIYTIKAQAFDGEEYSDIASFAIWVRNSDPYPPIAKALPEYQEVEIGDYAVFNGSESYDPNGDELNFTWYINEQELYGETVQYQFVEAGLYEVTLNVSDGLFWDTDTCIVYVNESVPPVNNPPFAIGLPVSQIVELGDPACFDASSSYDPDGDALEYSWDFGDGTNGSGVNVTRIYNTTDSYTVILNVSDGRTYDTDICLVIVYDNTTFNNRLNELAHWRAEYNGFDVAVVNVNDSFIGGNTDMNIKEFIEHVYWNWSAPHMSDNHVGYILLVGDTLFVESHHVGNYVSDRWYGQMDSDLIPDIMIGRFSVDDYRELDVIAEKTIHYEQNPEPGDWHKNVLLAKGTWPPNNPFLYKHSFIKDILLGCGGYEVSEVLRMLGGTANDISNVINNGTVMLNWCGHGNFNGWEIGFTRGSIRQLTNGYKLPVVISVACHTGEFQYEDDCFGEVFVNTPDKGAVAFFGASKAGGSPRYPYYALRSMFENFEYIVGKIINDLIKQAIPEGHNHPEYNLLGDPALDISGSTRYPTRPDLTLSHLNITITPDPPTYNDQQVTINATIHNIGGGDATNVTVQFLVISQHDSNQHIIGEHIISEILPRNHSTITQLWNVSEELSKNTLILQIDPYNTIDEAFELNNQAGNTVIILSDNTYVDDDFNESTPGWQIDHFDSIQDGIDSVIENGTVYVSNGTYQEHAVINKPIYLIGEDKNSTVIDGNGSENVIEIPVDWVNIIGFTIQNSGRSSDEAGINMVSDHNTITNCIIYNNSNGVYIEESSHNLISKNIITESIYNGILINLTSRNNIVFNNIITDNNVGVKIRRNLLSQPRNNILYHNNFINNNQNAYDNCNNKNKWYNETLQQGNYWSDYEDQHQNPIDLQPPYGIWDDPYNISGRTPPNQDIYPFRFPDGWEMIPCDLDHDGDVDLSDLAQLLSHYGTTSGATYEMGDIDGDGDVDLSDLAILLQNYGTST